MSKSMDDLRVWLAEAPEIGVVLIAAIPVLLALFGLVGGKELPAPVVVAAPEVEGKEGGGN